MHTYTDIHITYTPTLLHNNTLILLEGWKKNVTQTNFPYTTYTYLLNE